MEIVGWPADYSVVEQLERQGLPRLLLLPPDVPPVVSDDLLQDWVRLPASEVDVRCRLQRLWHEAVARPPRPVLEGDGRLSFGGAGSA